MKSLLIIITLLVSSLCSFTQSDSVRYEVYTGKFGNMDAVLHLSKVGENYNGYIWFTQLQWPMQLYGSQRIANTDSVQISAGSGPISVNLTGVFSKDVYNGIGTLGKEGQNSRKGHFQLKVSTDNNFTPFHYYYVEGHASLPPKLKNDSQCDFSAGTIWPEEAGLLSGSLVRTIASLLEIKTPVKNPQPSMNALKNNFIAAWQKENSKLTPKDASQMGMSLSSSRSQIIMTMYENEHFFTLADLSSEYTGGAHEMYSTSLYTFDKKTGKRLHLKDVISPAGLKILPAYLDRVARLQYGITNNLPLDQNNFFVKEIKPSENFYVTSTGIGFLYPPYALKSFADGEINLLVPFSALNQYLLPGFKK